MKFMIVARPVPRPRRGTAQPELVDNMHAYNESLTKAE